MIYSGFQGIDPNKIKLAQTFGATKGQILRKVVLPGSVPTLVAAPDQTFSPAAGDDVLVSIRPECLRATAAPVSPNVLRGEVRGDGSLYLGEIAERKLRIGDTSLTSYELNPTAAAVATAAATFEVAPEDVVLLPVDSTAPGAAE